MGDLVKSQLEVKITCYGHASPQWKAAQSQTEADRLNQQLSELRAKNVRIVVNKILNKELPTFKIAVPSVGLGSHGVGKGHTRFPNTGESNAPSDRSVVVDVDLTTSEQGYIFRPQAPRRVYTASKIWDLTVLIMNKIAGFGIVVFYVKLRILNPYSGKSIILAGWLEGGGAVFYGLNKEGEAVGNIFSHGSLSDMYGSARGRVGHTVSFSVPEAMDFDDWYNLGRGWTVRIDRLSIRLGIATKATVLVFPQLHTTPDWLDFDSKFLSIGWPGGDSFVVSGKLHMQGNNPGDWLELASPDKIIPVVNSSRFGETIILSFPTGKAAVSDLSADDQQKLNDYVTQRARTIAAFSQFYEVIQ